MFIRIAYRQRQPFPPLLLCLASLSSEGLGSPPVSCPAFASFTSRNDQALRNWSRQQELYTTNEASASSLPHFSWQLQFVRVDSTSGGQGQPLRFSRMRGFKWDPVFPYHGFVRMYQE